MAEVEDVLPVGQVVVPGEQRPELASLVPEDGEVAVVDVEVVILDVRVDRSSEREALVECVALLGREQRAMLRGDALPLREQGLGGACDVLARAEPRDVGADRPDREAGVVDPGSMVVVEDPRSAGEVEPGVLRLLEVGEPLLAAIAVREDCGELFLALGGGDLLGDAQLDREAREPPELVVGAEDEDVDRRHHPGDGLVRDIWKRLSATLVEDEVGPIAEVQELEVVLEDAVDPFEQAVVRVQERVTRTEPTALRHDRLVLELPELWHLEIDGAPPSRPRPCRAIARTARPSACSNGLPGVRRALLGGRGSPRP